MMDAVKATAGLAMSTFKDDDNADPEAAAMAEAEDQMLSNWKPSPDLKRKWMVKKDR